LKAAGLDEGYVRAWLLPDWWEDEIANADSGMATLEAYISRMIGLSIETLRSGEAIRVAPVSSIRFKKRIDCDDVEVAPAAAIAEQVARAMTEAVTIPSQFAGPVEAKDARQLILRKWPVPDLEGLLDFAWDHGIIVAHMAELPKASKKFDGLTMFVGDRPVIVLGSGRDSPAWRAFDLAHELGHILCGHVTPDSAMGEAGLESDDDFSAPSDDPEEAEANRFALELLTGDPAPSFKPVFGLTGAKLADIARQAGTEHKVDPGVLALIYGRSADRIGAAQTALNRMGQNSGAHAIISAGVRRHLKDDIPESVRMLVKLVTE
jgi:hypothetical protein